MIHGVEYQNWCTPCAPIWYPCGVLMCVPIFRPEVMLETFLCLHPHFKRQGLFLKVELTASAKTGQQALSLHPDPTLRPAMSNLYVGADDFNSGPRVFVASTSPTEVTEIQI